MKKKKRLKDPNKFGKSIIDEITKEGKDPAAVSLGRRGGLKGGKARALVLTPERRKEIAQYAARKRWEKKK